MARSRTAAAPSPAQQTAKTQAAKPQAKAPVKASAKAQAKTAVVPKAPAVVLAAEAVAPAKVAKPATKPKKAAKPAREDKPRKPKLVRDSFTMPKDEYAVIDALKQRAATLGAPAKKSELLRAGIKALAAMPDAALRAALAAVPAIKTGRPKAN